MTFKKWSSTGSAWGFNQEANLYNLYQAYVSQEPQIYSGHKNKCRKNVHISHPKGGPSSKSKPYRYSYLKEESTIFLYGGVNKQFHQYRIIPDDQQQRGPYRPGLGKYIR